MNHRKPTQLKVIQGTFRKDRAAIHEPEPTPVSNIPKPPSYLNKWAKNLWKDLAAELYEKRMLTIVDLPALEELCLNYGLYRELYDAITHYKDEEGKRKKRTIAQYLQGRNSQTMPEYIQMTKAFQMFKSLMTEFGMTPASRSRVNAPPPKEESVDPMEALLNEG